MNDKNYDSRLSEAITWLRFPLIFLIIMLHCYSVQRLEGDHEVYFKVLYPFSLWLGETGVPGFYFISGFLFFLSKKKYSEKIQSRIRTLLLPYLTWNTLILAIYIVLLLIGHPMEIIGKSIADYDIIDYIRLYWDRGLYDDGNFVPLLCPLWYIRNLFIMSIFSPIFYYIIKHAREPFLICLAIWWLITPRNAFIPQTVFFFSLGAYFPIHHINPLKAISERRGLFMSLFVFFAFSDILSHIAIETPINLQLHRLSLICNIPALLFLGDYCIRHGFHHQLLPKSAFIIFCIHYPIVVFLRKSSIYIFADVPDYIHIILYFACIIIATALSMFFYLVLNRYCPKIKNILSGNR